MRVCEECKKKFSRNLKESFKAFDRRKFCSKICKSKVAERKIYVRRTPNTKFVDKNCSVCKNVFTSIKRKRLVRCEDCRNKSNLSNKTKKDLFEKCNWQNARSTIQSHARKVLTNETKECKICKYAKHVEVCHIKSVNSFSDTSLISEINKLENLVYLCPNHHWEFDNNLLRLDAGECNGSTKVS